MDYIVVNADIKNSRFTKFNKNQYEQSIELLNDEFKHVLLVKFTMLKGDEVQGVLDKTVNIFEFIRKLKYAFLPYELRIGVGLGEIENEAEIKRVNHSWELNGEAFFHARDAVDFMKETKRKKDFEYSVIFSLKNNRLDQRINIFYSYIDEQLSKWNDDIWEITLLEEKGYKYEEIAKTLMLNNEDHLDLNQIKKERVNITRKIQRSNWFKIKQTELVLLEIFREGIL